MHNPSVLLYRKLNNRTGYLKITEQSNKYEFKFKITEDISEATKFSYFTALDFIDNHYYFSSFLVMKLYGICQKCEGDYLSPVDNYICNKCRKELI